ncbi:MAG: hypothetical protein ACQ9MH_08180 [Nitrospinales bacterium]
MKKIYIAVASVVFLFIGASLAHASCGSANCSLVIGSQEGVSQKGRFVVDLSYRYIPQENKRKGTGDTGEVLIPKIDFEAWEIEPEHHREFLTINKLAQMDVSYGFTENFTVTMNIPFFNDRYHEHDDGVHDGDEGEFTNQDGSTGFGDITVLLKYAVVNTIKHLLVAGAGVKFASGEYLLKNSEGAINEPTIMPGTGSYDAILSAYYNFSFIPNRLNLFASLSHRFTSENPLQYQFGDSTLIDGGLSYLLTEKIIATAQINARISRRDMFAGMYVPSTGREIVNFTPGARLIVSENASIYSHVQIPVYKRVNESNLVPAYSFIMGATYGF